MDSASAATGLALIAIVIAVVWTWGGNRRNKP